MIPKPPTDTPANARPKSAADNHSIVEQHGPESNAGHGSQTSCPAAPGRLAPPVTGRATGLTRPETVSRLVAKLREHLIVRITTDFTGDIFENRFQCIIQAIDRQRIERPTC